MKKLLLVALMLPIAASAFASAQAKTAARPAAQHAARTTLSHASGTIEKFDAASKTLTVRHDGKDMQFAVTDSTSIMKGKDKADLASATGMEARIDYSVSGATKNAVKIELSGGKTATTKK